MPAPYLVDSHCHLNFKGLGEDVDGVIARAVEWKVQAYLAINTKIREFDQVLAMANPSDRLHCIVVQPGSRPGRQLHQRGRTTSSCVV